MNLKSIKLVIFTFLFSSQSYAIDLNAKGFVTFSYSQSDSDIEYRDTISDDGEYTNGTRAGLQFFSVLSSKTEAFIQALADGDNGRDFNFSLDIAHVSYNLNNDHKILGGKIRLPVWMISDYRQVGSLYPWINPPEEVYEIVPLEDIGANDTFFGVSLEGSLYREGFSELSYRFYNGGSERSGQDLETRIKNLHGLLLNYRFGDFEFKLSYLNTLSMGEKTLPGGLIDDVSKGRTEYFSSGFRYESDNLLIMSELSRVLGETRSYEDVKSYFVMGGIYLDDQNFLLHATFSDVLNSSKSDLDIFQNSLTLGLNYHIELSTVLKFEYKTVFLEQQPQILKPKASDDEDDIHRPAGFFKEHPNDDVKIFSVSINTMF